jgi:hypothetical protein
MAEDVKTANSGTNESTTPDEKEKAPWEKLAITMDKRADLAVSLVTVSVGAFLLIASRDIRPGSVTDPVTSRGIPEILGLFLVIGGMVRVITRLLSWSQLPGHLVPEEGQEDEQGYPASWARAIGVIFVSLLWGWLLKPLGFLFITPVYLSVTLWIMGVRSWVKIAAFTIIYTVTAWVIFGPLLGSRIPLGPLTALARSLGLIP